MTKTLTIYNTLADIPVCYCKCKKPKRKKNVCLYCGLVIRKAKEK